MTPLTHNTRSVFSMSGFAVLEHRIARRVKNASISAIKEMTVLAQEYADVISLAQGTPSFQLPENIKERLHKELDTNPKLNKYCTPFTGLVELKTELAKKIKKTRGIDIDPKKEIYITVGAMEGVATAILTVTDPGDEVILLSPCFPSHIVQITLAAGVPIHVPLNEENGWRLNIEELRARITSKTKAIILSSPNNPTGTVFTESDVRAIAELAQLHDFWIITDEPYDFLLYDNKQLFTALHMEELKDRLIAVFSFSKEYAMSGFRLGYVYSSEGAINQMLKIHDAFSVTASTISQYAAIEALQGSQNSVLFFREEYSKRRNLVCKRLDRLGSLFKYHKPQGAYYIFPKILIDIDDYEFALQILKETHVAVVPGSAFGPAGKGHIRICFSMTEDEINKAFDRLDRWWEDKLKSQNTKLKITAQS